MGRRRETPTEVVDRIVFEQEGKASLRAIADGLNRDGFRLYVEDGAGGRQRFQLSWHLSYTTPSACCRLKPIRWHRPSRFGAEGDATEVTQCRGCAKYCAIVRAGPNNDEQSFGEGLRKHLGLVGPIALGKGEGKVGYRGAFVLPLHVDNALKVFEEFD